MYAPSFFQETRVDEIHRVITGHPLGALVTHGPNGLDATHLPFEFEAAAGPHGMLLAHVARGNPVWKSCQDGQDVMVIFQGAEAYVSPNWYPSKHETHQQVPTWNYQVVHVHGRIRIRDDKDAVRQIVTRLTRTHEARATADGSRPWSLNDAPEAYIDKMLGAIVGIEVEIDRIVAVSKANQNKDERDRHGARDAMRERGRNDMADVIDNGVPGRR
ncbi:FMN-binding negative transcriptional regulator [Cupriavidus sp. RAF12]|uniref:FMN-binding negative transcriptional regulator n=1 Tax=Cupriavidus sp. RAF12 TaxID=3233050 RepID=UPI003F8F45D5